MARIRLPSSMAPVAIPKLPLLKCTLLLTLLTLFLFGSRLPSEMKKLATAQSPSFHPGAMNFKDRFPVTDDTPFPQTVVRLSLSFWDANTNGMVFAIVLGGAALSLLLTSTLVQRLVAQRGLRGVVGGMVLGLPLNMCANCSAVSACGIGGDSQSGPETIFGVILGSALFNVIGLFAIWTLFPWPVFVARFLFSVLLTFVILPLVSRRWSPRRATVAVNIPPGLSSSTPVTWSNALMTSMRDWWDACARLAYRLVPTMLVATVAIAVVRALLSQTTLGLVAGDSLLATASGAVFGTLVSIPVLFEIPLALVAAQLGFSIGGVAAIVCSAPSVGIFTVLLTRKQVGMRVPLAMLGATCLLSLLAGILAQGLALLGGAV